jgi:drug/metabolite transporter (DMT)-like permease
VIQAYVLGHGLGHGFLGTTVAAIPLLTILLSIPMLGIVPTWRELTGVVGGLLCMGLILDAGVQRGAPWELLALTLLVPVSSAVSNTFVKWKLSHVSAGPLTAAVLATAGLTLIPLELYGPALSAFDLAAPASADVGGLDVIYLLLLGVIGSGISTMVFTWMILVRGPLFAGMTTYVVPVIALLWGQFDRETISTEQVAAIAGVLAMVALVQWRPRGRPAAALRPAVAEALAPPAPAALAVEASPPSSPVGGCSATDSLAT